MDPRLRAFAIQPRRQNTTSGLLHQLRQLYSEAQNPQLFLLLRRELAWGSLTAPAGSHLSLGAHLNYMHVDTWSVLGLFLQTGVGRKEGSEQLGYVFTLRNHLGSIGTGMHALPGTIPKLCQEQPPTHSTETEIAPHNCWR